MSKLEFKPADFAVAWCEPECAAKEMDVVLAQAICRVANTRLAEMLRDAPEVFVNSKAPGHSWCWKDRGFHSDKNATSRARLVNVERIDGK